MDVVSMPMKRTETRTAHRGVTVARLAAHSSRSQCSRFRGRSRILAHASRAGLAPQCLKHQPDDCRGRRAAGRVTCERLVAPSTLWRFQLPPPADVRDDQERHSDRVEDPGKPVAAREVPEAHAGLDRADKRDHPTLRGKGLHPVSVPAFPEPRAETPTVLPTQPPSTASGHAQSRRTARRSGDELTVVGRRWRPACC